MKFGLSTFDNYNQAGLNGVWMANVAICIRGSLFNQSNIFPLRYTDSHHLSFAPGTRHPAPRILQDAQ